MKRRIPILLKVILLGIVVSILTSGTALVVSHFHQKKQVEKNYLDNINHTLDAVDEVFTNNDSTNTDAYVDAFDYSKQYIKKIYDEDPEKRQQGENESFAEYAKYYAELYPWLYPHDPHFGFLTKPEADLKAAYYTITNLLNNFQMSSDTISVFAYYIDDNNRMVFLADTRMDDSERKENDYFHIPGTYYQLSEGDISTSEKHPILVLSGYQTRYTAVYSRDEVNPELIAYVSIQYSLDKVHQETVNILKNELLIMGLSSLVLIAIYTLFSYLLFVRNINKLSKASSDIRERLVNKKMKDVVDIEVKSHDEMRDLADSFNEMERAIINYVDIIHKEAKEKERTNAELNVASKIQLDSLPNRTFDDSQTSIRAYIKPAKEVGGDFYDYFYLDDHRLALIVADVSGKGIPASLFMMKGKELIKSAVQSSKSLVDAISSVNKILAKNNNELLFITSFIGVIDFKKNKINYVNAGHEKPYLVSNNKVIKLDGVSNVVLGVEENHVYQEESHEFKEGDYLLMFTDGLNESINKNNEEFGYARIEEALKDSSALPLDEVINRINTSFDSFTNSKDQFDDVTMLLVKSCSNELKLNYKNSDYHIITDAVDKFNEKFSFLSEKTKASVGVIIDEILNNFLSYEKKDDLEINVEFSLVKDGLQVVLSNNGSDFNPFKNHQDKHLDKFDHEIEPGGFGLTIVKDLSKSYSYEYKNSHPTITVVVE
ncbi:MAG: SpoIIE family protein phosphatase [Bacilli bacterium]|nr:SpoIIE family protein phosphatase [Bacilli bacterium]